MDAEMATVYATVLCLTQSSSMGVFVRGEESHEELKIAAMLDKLNNAGGGNVLFLVTGIDNFMTECQSLLSLVPRY